MYDQSDKEGNPIDEEARLMRANKDKYLFSINYSEMPQIGIEYTSE